MRGSEVMLALAGLTVIAGILAGSDLLFIGAFIFAAASAICRTIEDARP